jgi:TonB family protein
MNGESKGKGICGLRQGTLRLFQAAALALVVAMAMPARAADERAVKTRVAPVYPEIARRMKIAGVVRVEATVDAEGRVVDVKTVSGNHMLSPAAEQAVHNWKFAAGDGVSTVEVDVNFALNN